jgi:hypothetical protein
MHRASSHYRLPHKGDHALCGSIYDLAQANSADASPVLLRGNKRQCHLWVARLFGTSGCDTPMRAARPKEKLWPGGKTGPINIEAAYLDMRPSNGFVCAVHLLSELIVEDWFTG